MNKNWRSLCVEVVTLETRLWIRDGISPNAKRRLKSEKARSRRGTAMGVGGNDANEHGVFIFHAPDVRAENLLANEEAIIGGERVAENAASVENGGGIVDSDIKAEDFTENPNQSQENGANMEEDSFESLGNGHEKINSQSNSNSSHQNNHHIQKNKSQDRSQKQTSPIRRLLLTDMARELLTRQHHYRHLQRLGIRESIIRHIMNHHQRYRHHFPRHDHQSQQIHQYNQSSPVQDAKKSIGEMIVNVDGNFCLSWFAPSGIQVMSVDLESDAREDNDDDAVRHASFGRGECESVACCYEWRGYRHAMEVLVPFGFATEFVRVSVCTSLGLAETSFLEADHARERRIFNLSHSC